MKTLSSLFLVFFLSISVAWALSIDGKGVWCDRGINSFGYWFYDGQSTEYVIKDQEVFGSIHNPFDYQELFKAVRILVNHDKVLDRTTLELTIGSGNLAKIYQCHVVQTLDELKRTLQRIIDQGVPGNTS
ncbi:MAG: hypothetical protein CMM32_09505 [Rhodospirillaceae bacterium]|nr:hypothetical protein [Rhodospirillaceae bacterium]